jgi:putative protease
MAEVEVGRVEHYFGRIGVVGIGLTARVAIGDTIHVKGHTTDLVRAVESMQIDNEAVEEAGAGDAVGIVVGERCRAGDHVFRVES